MLGLFKREVSYELGRKCSLQQGVFTDEAVRFLPAPVRRYLDVCGWIGRPMMSNVALGISGMLLKLDLDKPFVKVKSYQFNAVATPVRIAFMSAALKGIIPFSGRDKYQDGKGNMLIRVLGLFTVVNQSGPEMDCSALVTFLAEVFLAPACLLQPYLSWHTLDDNTAKAVISYNGTVVSGVFYFNASGFLERFESSDRYMRRQDGTFSKLGWAVNYEGYELRNSVRIATRLSASWLTPEGPEEYARMTIAGARYNVRQINEVLDCVRAQ